MLKLYINFFVFANNWTNRLLIIIKYFLYAFQILTNIFEKPIQSYPFFNKINKSKKLCFSIRNNNNFLIKSFLANKFSIKHY